MRLVVVPRGVWVLDIRNSSSLDPGSMTDRYPLKTRFAFRIFP
jgi:hypothetical protein